MNNKIKKMFNIKNPKINTLRDLYAYYLLTLIMSVIASKGFLEFIALDISILMLFWYAVKRIQPLKVK